MTEDNISKDFLCKDNSVKSSFTKKNALSSRDLEWSINSSLLVASHAAANGSIVRTRFPPEPNGYLHIGHAKSMNVNFSLAFDKVDVSHNNRRTIFRYDDTNPEVESNEYIDSFCRDLEWLGWKPERTTYSSDYFNILHNFAVLLITKGLAYVCDMSKDEIEYQRDLAKRRSNARNTGKNPDIYAPIPSTDILPGRNRDSSVNINLELFEDMRLGLFDEGTMTLRLKMDFESSNPNMYDLVAYRIKYFPHPHVGTRWCIYPSYDFSHCICDSLEGIDYSICTLEFETRRESYFWILAALNIYRPKVYEMSRLNLEYTVLSKRKLSMIVEKKYVRGWDDPRMPTLSGLRRRGYTKEIIKAFCNSVGATRAMNVVEMKRFDQIARLNLSSISRRAMAVLDPVKVVITNFQDEAKKLVDGLGGMRFVVQNSPTNVSLGSHTVTLTDVIYIDSSDFHFEDHPMYYGLAPKKAVGIKYHGGNLFCDEFVLAGNKVKELLCRLDTSVGRKKPKSFITWVPKNAVSCEVRVYNHLFLVSEPSERWESELNHMSEELYTHALVDASVNEIVNVEHVNKWKSNPTIQFERIGYFVVDVDTTKNSFKNKGRIVFNRIVSLKEEVFKKEISDKITAKGLARKEKIQKDREKKEVRMKIKPENMFKEAPEYMGIYSKFNEDGLPTHYSNGLLLTKSAMKKLNKERAKHMRVFASCQKEA